MPELRCVLLLMAGLAFSHNLFCQEFMVLEKIGNPKRIKFAPGDQLKFKTRLNDTIYTDQISAVFDSAVALGNMVVKYQDLQKVWVYKPTFAGRRLKTIALLGGGVFFTVDTFNRLVNKNNPLVTKTSLIVLGTGLTIGGIIHLSEVRWFRLGKNKQARYMDLRMEVK